MQEERLDLAGLRCPLPAMLTRKALRRLRPGDVLVVACTDPLAAIDVPNLLRESGDDLLGSDVEGPTLTFRIRKASPAG